MSELQISNTLSLPLDAVTSTLVVYGGKGMGKTNLASVLVEEFAFARQRVVVIDPMGVWWGLRHDAEGRGAGIEMLVLGGVHGDLPIEPTSGERIADLVVDEDANVIIDISRRPDGSMWAIAERISFVTAYAKRLYQRQGEKRRPIMQVIDEAARFAPQIVRAGDMEVAKCMGAIAVIVEEGRNVGIGVTLVTQRSARLNKDVAELADCMIAFRTVGPNSMRAVLDWLGEHVDKARLKELGEQLRSLPRGSALVVSPGWLEFEGVVPMRKRKTFDSSATPKTGEEVRASGPAARPDIAKYHARLADIIERAQADDPKALKARVAELEKQLAARSAAVREIEVERVVEKPILSDVDRLRITDAIEKFDAIAGTFFDELETVGTVMRDIEATIKLADQLPVVRRASGLAASLAPAFARAKTRSETFAAIKDGAAAIARTGISEPAKTTEGLGKCEREILGALASRHPLTLTRVQVATLSGYSVTSSTFSNGCGALRSAGLIDYTGDGIALTAAGLKTAGGKRPPRNPAEVRELWMSKLTSREGQMLGAVIGVGDRGIERPALANAVGMSLTSSTFSNYLGKLHSLELVAKGSDGRERAARELLA